MVQINLLPWREEERKYKKIYFYIRVLGCIVATILLLALYHIYLNSVITDEQAKGNYLQTALDEEQAKLRVYEKKLKLKMQVEEKLNFIVALRSSSYRAVRLLDELTRVVPEAVTLSKIVREGDSITIFGKAESNLQVTQFMKKIAESRVFQQPILTEISAKENVNGDERIFALKVEQRE
jgi:type IV pilus assembly protein PilN